MAQILNEHPGFGSAFGQGFGQAFGSGLSEGLANLAQAKMDQIRQREDYKVLSSLGVDPQQAKFISRLPTEQRNQLIGKFFDTAGQQQQQQSVQSQAPQAQPEFESRPTQSQQPSLSQLFSQQPNSVLSPEILDQVLRSPVRQQQQRQIAAQEQQQIRQQAQPEQMGPQPTALAPKIAQPEAKATRAGRPSLSSVLNPKEAEAQRKAEKEARVEQFNREKLERTEQAAAQRQTQGYYEEVVGAEKAAKESDADLNKLKKLVEKGKLPPAKLYKTLKDIEENLQSYGGAVKNVGAGALLGAQLGSIPGAIAGGIAGLVASPVATLAMYGVRGAYPDTEEFEKISNGFIRYAKGIFGSRITDADLKAFLATVPTLANTEHGKKAIINNMELLNKAVHEKYKSMREIIKENGGTRPADLALLVQDRLDAHLDKLAADWESSSESAESSVLKSV